MCPPIFIRWAHVEGQVRVIERQVVVGVVERERHAEAKQADVEVGVHRVAQWRCVSATARRVVIGVARANRSRYEQRVALGNL